jgi:Fatty acid cis/trans isomerase (CTI)
MLAPSRFVALGSVIAGCALSGVLFGCSASPARVATGASPSEPRPVAAPPPPPDVVAAHAAAAEVFEQRCVVCHGCYDAPCQLQLGSMEGIARGATKAEVYDGARLRAIPPTRLFVDAHSERDWREKGFWSVLGARPERGLIAKMLELKRAHPLPDDVMLSETFELGIGRKQQCPKPDDFDGYAEDHALWGMPYALPGLSDGEHRAVMAWLEAGARAPAPPAPSAALGVELAKWEEFLNHPSPKSRLSARYIYEHLFLASLYFPDVEAGTFFRLVRSRTPTGEPVEEIPTRRPFDDPHTALYYYRFVQRQGPVLDKTHMPYALGDARLARFHALFIEPYYEVPELPGFSPEIASNPLKAFGALPVKSRYRFMLEEAEFTMGGFIKGPVCRGQVALNVIEDRFWVVFVDPDVPWLAEEATLLGRTSDLLALPAEEGSNVGLLAWRNFTKKHAAFVKQKSVFLERMARDGARVDLSAIWDGDGHNENAALTVYRHFDNATVVKGLLGGPSKTTWVVGYALLERIHALLVAGFDVFGNIGHQLNTRMYMDFLRMEGEYNYLLLLPPERRKQLVQYWYRDADDDVRSRVYGSLAHFTAKPNVTYRTSRPELELAAMLGERLERVRSIAYSIEARAPAKDLAALAPLAELRGTAASLMPESSFLAVRGKGGALRHYTVIRDSAHTNVAELFREHDRRVPSEDELNVVPGFLGAYPNALFRVDEGDLEAFVSAVRTLASPKDYGALRVRFGVLRSTPDFWAHSDALMEARRDVTAPGSGLLDYNRLDPY